MKQSERPLIQVFSKTVTIMAPPADVWAALTVPALMREWMSDSDGETITDWQVGTPVGVQRGVSNTVKFESNAAWCWKMEQENGAIPTGLDIAPARCAGMLHSGRVCTNTC